MERITERIFIEILKTMEGKQIEITLEGMLKARKIINKLNCSVKNNIIVMQEAESKEYVQIDINEAYCTKANKERTIIQANIDTMNEDTIITIKV